jgi:Zn ribbon nucleic-acid-binding protein
MAACPACERHLTRRHRSPIERLLYSDAYECRHCGHQVRRLRRSFRFPWSRYTCCPQCARQDVRVAARRDKVDSVSTHLLSRVQRWTGAPLNKCPACRLQYYDWRSRLITRTDTIADA